MSYSVRNVAVAGDGFGGFGTVFEEVCSNYPNYSLGTKLTLHCHIRRVKMDLYHFFHWALTSEPHVLEIYGPVKAQACLIQLPKTGAESVLQNTSINHTQNFSRRSQDQKEPNSCTQKALTLLASCKLSVDSLFSPTVLHFNMLLKLYLPQNDGMSLNMK